LTSVNASDVQFVNVDDLLAGNSPDSLTAVLSKNEDNIEALQKALGSNPALGLLLATSDSAAAKVTPPAATPMPSMSAKPSAKDVVAADVSADNKVVLYYWKKHK